MQGSQRALRIKQLVGVWLFCLMASTAVKAEIPLWDIVLSSGSATQNLSPNLNASVSYTVRNQSSKPKTVVMLPIQAVSHPPACRLAPRGQAGSTCVLNLVITGSQLPATGIQGGPKVCRQNPNGTANLTQCYQPDAAQVLNITKVGLAFDLGGTVNSLKAGESVTLQNNGGDDNTVFGHASIVNFPFVFSQKVQAGSSYNVTVKTQPATQICSVSNGTGIMPSGNLTNISVMCADTYSVGGTISVESSGVVTLQNNGTDDLTQGSGAFAFSTRLSSGASYHVTVKTAPAGQTCTVTNGSGIVSSQNITNVGVVCHSNAYPVGGNLSGLASGETVTLKNSNGDTLSLTANGPFTFSQMVANGATYNVTVETQPLTQICSVTNGSGAVNDAPVNNIVVSCTNTYSIGGFAYGLLPTSTNLVLKNDDNNETLNVPNDGIFVFPTRLSTGESYHIQVMTQPTDQICDVTNAEGTVGTQNVSNIEVICSEDAYTLGGNVTGLGNGKNVTLAVKAGSTNKVIVTGSASPAVAFTFPEDVPVGSQYHVVVDTQPLNQTCTPDPVTTQGRMPTQAVNNLLIICSDEAYSVGGSVTGLDPQESVILSLNGGAGLVVPQASPNFTFPTDLANGATYIVTVQTHPADKICTITNPTGIISGANVTNIDVQCSTSTTLSSNVNKLALSVTGLTEYGVPGNPSSGKARIITITNTGALSTSGLNVTLPNWPAGTSAVNSCSGELAPDEACAIAITPGATATSNNPVSGQPCSNGSAPAMFQVEVTANNATSLSIPVSVLNYGCIYEGGYVYAFDDTPSSGVSVKGKVLTTTNEDVQGLPWSVETSSVYGTSEISTPSSPNPSTFQISGQLPCRGGTDGQCDTNNVLIQYSSVNPVSYVPGFCTTITNGGHTDWYLPAICEMAPGSNNGCGTQSVPATQNVMTSLFVKGLIPFPGPLPVVNYWTSTTFSQDPNNKVWIQSYSSQGVGAFTDTMTSDSFSLRCARIF